MNYKQCAKLLLSHESILILTHKNPDGDTFGSAAALCSALRRGGRTAYLYNNPQFTPKQLPFVAPFIAPDNFRAKYVVAVDVASDNMLPQGFTGEVNLCIDHHPGGGAYAVESLVRDEKSSCAEIVTELIVNLNANLSGDEATLLYIGLSTDTGCFKYSNVNAASFRTAAELMRSGADHAMVSELFFRKVSVARLRLEGMIYGGMEYYRDGKIAIAIISLDMMEKSGASEDDCDDLAGLAGRSEGSLVNLTIREQEDGSCKVSVRTGEEVSSSEICAVFGGGGHSKAAGCTIYGKPEKARDMLLNVIDEVWK